MCASPVEWEVTREKVINIGERKQDVYSLLNCIRESYLRPNRCLSALPSCSLISIQIMAKHGLILFFNKKEAAIVYSFVISSQKVMIRPFLVMIWIKLRLQERKADRSNDKDTGMICLGPNLESQTCASTDPNRTLPKPYKVCDFRTVPFVYEYYQRINILCPLTHDLTRMERFCSYKHAFGEFKLTVWPTCQAEIHHMNSGWESSHPIWRAMQILLAHI